MLDGLREFVNIVGIFIILLIGYVAYDLIKSDAIESSTIIVPEIRLVTDGKTVDTVYIYKKK